MPKLLTGVKESLHIKSRGTLIVLNHYDDWRIPSDKKIHKGEIIRLLKEDHSGVITYIKDIDFIRKEGSEFVVLTVHNDIPHSEYSTGTLVFLEREDDTPIMRHNQKAIFFDSES